MSQEHTHDAEATDDARNPRLLPREATGKTLFIDAFSGVSGDMLVASLIDLGVPFELVRDSVRSLPLSGVSVSLATVVRSGIAALRFLVDAHDEQPERSYGSIRDMLSASRIGEGALSIAQRAFLHLARAEASVHRCALEDVHFHEVGAIDSIVDIVAAAVAVDHLGAEVITSPMPMGRGVVHARHGTLPLPAPATVECLRGVPTYDADIDAELVTPTGACLVASVSARFARWPSIRPERVGWGGGARELPDRPNLLRAVLGDADRAAANGPGFSVLEANVDDQSPEQIAYAAEALFAVGALDVWTVPIGMKKGRSAVMLCALVRSSGLDAASRCMLAETASLGVRIRSVDRVERPRTIIDVPTRYGTVRVKVASGDGLPAHYAPEFDDVCRLAREHREPVKRVYEEALAAVRSVPTR